MKPQLLIVLFTVVLFATLSQAMDPKHYPWRGCQCQCGGENGGHCHCPKNIKLEGGCRDGGNHNICFPLRDRCPKW